MGSYSRRLSRTQRRWSTRHQIDMAWLAAPGRPQRDVAIHGDDLCATSVITPCVQSANLRGTHSWNRRGGCASKKNVPFRSGADGDAANELAGATIPLLR